jgi:hypothetical protein
MSKNKRSRIGLTKALRIIANSDNTFRVYGEAIGSANSTTTVVKKVVVEEKHHDWDLPSRVVDIDANTLELTAFCHPRHAIMTPSKKSSGAAPATSGTDDMTVTITLDPGTTGEDMTVCTFPDVEHDD